MFIAHITAGFGDKVGKDIQKPAIVSSISSQHAMATAPPTSSSTPKIEPKCDTNALSGIPYNVFDGSAGNIYGNFCDAVGKDRKTKLTWHVDSRGDRKNSKRYLRYKRTLPSNPDAYRTFDFELEWAPTSGDCSIKCNDAYAAMALSPCGHQGGQQTGRTASASLDVGCGTYSYKITGADVPPP